MEKETLIQEKYLTNAELGISEAQAMRDRYTFSPFIEDWDDPIMDIYDEIWVPIIRAELNNGSK